MRFSVGSLSTVEAVVYPVCNESIQEGALYGLRIKEHMGDKGALSWFRGSDLPSDVLVVGAGSKEKLGLESIRNAAGTAGRELQKERLSEVDIDFSVLTDGFGSLLSEEEVATAWVEGWLLGTYRFDKYKSEKPSNRVLHVRLRGNASAQMELAVRKGEIRAQGTILARDLGNEPPNGLRPITLAERVMERFNGEPVNITLYKGEQLEELEMNGLIAVGKGSENPPVMIELRYCSDSLKPLIALVGKGITFDTGGINLKVSPYLSNMRMDMGGAAAVIGALDIIIKSGMQANVVALIAAAENMPDGRSMLPGEVIRYANGLTVQVGNTDAEGRLVLADALIRARKLGAGQIVDIATLTGSCFSALGTAMAGVWGTNDLPEIMCTLGKLNGERVWEMPLVDEYDEMLKSPYADLCSITGAAFAGAITAALFLRRFVDPSTKWVHIDMAGTMEATSSQGYQVEGASGYGARLLADFVAAQSNYGNK